MGYNAAWLAVLGKSEESVCAHLGYARTGDLQSVPDWPTSAARLSSGWYVVVLNDDVLPDEESLRRLSIEAEVLCCDISESVMYSKSVLWRAGSEVWSVTHDSEQERRHLQAQGTTPDFYEGVRDRLSSEQDAHDEQNRNPTVDFLFDVPIEVAQMLTGFRIDEEPETEEPEWERLAPLEAKRPWWRRLLG